MNDYGWTEHIDKTGTPCAYCGEPSTETLVLEPEEYAKGELKRRGKRVGVCDQHNRERDDPAKALSFRRRKAKGVEQLAMDVDDGVGRGIHGEAA